MPSPFRTQQDLILETLAIIGVLSPGQPTDPEDVSYISSMMDATLRKLAALDIVTVPNPDETPAVYFNDLCACIAGEACLKFGVSAEDYVNLNAAGLGGAGNIPVGGGAAAKSLRAINRARYTGEVAQSQFF